MNGTLWKIALLSVERRYQVREHSMPEVRCRQLAVLIAITVALSACAGTPTPVKLAAPETTTSLAFNPADGSLLKTDAAGLFRLAPTTQTWEALQVPPASGLTGVVVHPDDPATLYVSGIAAGVLKSMDGGKNWQVINSGLPSTEVTALAMHSFRRETLYVWLKNSGIFRTEDGAAQWNRMPDPGPPDTNVRGLVHSTLPGSMNTGWLYAATPSGVYLSMDCF